MRINITARRFKLKEPLRQFTRDEVSRLTKYYDSIVDVDVILSWEKHNRIAEINLAVYGTLLTAEARSEDMKKSIYEAVDKMERQLVKYKDRLRDFDHRRAVGQRFSA